MSALGRRCSVQRFSTNAPHNDHVLLPLCTCKHEFHFSGRKKKKKDRSAAKSYRGCRLLAKCLPPLLPPCYRCDGRKTKSSFISRRGAPQASRCVQGKQANNTGASEVRGLIGGGKAARSTAHLLARWEARAHQLAPADTQSHQGYFPQLSSGRRRGLLAHASQSY